MISSHRNEPSAPPQTLPRDPFYIVVQKSTKKSIEESYNSNLSKQIGKIHIFCGALAFFTGVCLLINTNHNGAYGGIDEVGIGIYSSFPFFLCGVLGLISAKTTNSRSVIGTLIFGIFTAISSASLSIFSLIALGSGLCSYSQCDHAVSVGMNVLQLLIGIVEFVLAIISSALSCKATCCRDTLDTSTQSKVMFSPSGGLDHHQIVSLAQQVGQPDAEGGGDLPRYADLASVVVEDKLGGKM